MTAAIAIPFTFDDATHIYRDANSIIRPSVTQCLKAEGFINFDGIRPDVLERKRRLGQLVHEASKYWDQGQDLDDFNIPPMVFEYLTGYINFREDCAFIPNVIEARSLATLNGMTYGMCPDRMGMLQGYPHVLELKCSVNEHPAWGLQLAGYDVGDPIPGIRRRRIAVQLDPKFKRGYKLSRPFEDPSDYQVWANTLANTIWKMNHKLYVNEDVDERVPA